jgi:hypothetical protein
MMSGSMEITEQERQCAMNILKQKMKIKAEHQRLFRKHLDKPFVNDLSKFCVKITNIGNVFDLYTTRFTTDTYFQNQRFKDRIEWAGSLYSTMLRFPQNTPDKMLFILDMNNTTNKIVGIGLVLNKLSKDQSINIYDNPTFNNYVYKSKYYIQLIDINQRGKYQDFVENTWVEYIEKEFETKLFYGKGHSKRGGSFMCFPRKFLQEKHIIFILTLFVILNPNNFIENVMEKVNV